MAALLALPCLRHPPWMDPAKGTRHHTFPHVQIVWSRAAAHGRRRNGPHGQVLPDQRDPAPRRGTRQCRCLPPPRSQSPPNVASLARVLKLEGAALAAPPLLESAPAATGRRTWRGLSECFPNAARAHLPNSPTDRYSLNPFVFKGLGRARCARRWRVTDRAPALFPTELGLHPVHPLQRHAPGRGPVPDP
ncbi:hypothetical protein DFH94DRAFT_486961 [Russula ochroleuca]|uniref:Uncharacterized protein n=1 Tax=Russula ochroleuca TaxID=152965 RepID=A0A9P5T938_9AGAM|nr:hypothetical protein DFH94DRAFT_486961 [Russula ochroleuca]